MTRRALFWCGYVKPPPGRFEAPGASDDAITLANDLEFAVAAARKLGVQDKDMYAFVCGPELVPAGYTGQRFVPTLSALERILTGLARLSIAEDATFFFATNHGIPEGLLTSGLVDEFEQDAPSLLTPTTLKQRLDALSGVQVMIIAACYAGSFLPLAQPDRRLVLAACGDEVYVAGGSVAWAGFPAELFRAWCGISPDEAACPPRMDVDAAFTFAERAVMSGDAGRRIQPRRAGNIQWPP